MERLANTRLQSSLVWGADPCEGLFPELDFSPPPATGPVPECWRAFVDVPHLNRYYERIVHYVRNPVETETRAGCRRVAVLGQAVFETDANGFVRTFLWGWEQRDFGCWLKPSGQIAIGNTPHAWTWLELFRQGFMAELAPRLRLDAEDLEAYSRWVFRRFRRRLRQECDLRHMRELVGAGLALDPLAVQVARRIRLGYHLHRYATVRDYNVAVAHLPAFRKLQKEAPNLVPLYALHAYALGSVASSEPAQRLKRYLTETYGLRQSTWALIHGIRPRWLYLLEHFYEGSAAKASIDLLRLIQELGCRRAPPRWYLWTLLEIFGHHGNRLEEYWQRWLPYARALRRLTLLIEAADARQQDEMRSRLYDVLAWIVDQDAHALRGLSRAGWTWFVRHAAAWREDQEKRAAVVPRSWAVPFEEFRAGEYTVRVLRNHEELLREARAMSHCVDLYADRCLTGDHLILSVRREGRARPIATAHLRQVYVRWKLEHVAGAANTVARPVAVRLVRAALAQINAMNWTSGPAPCVIDEPAATQLDAPAMDWRDAADEGAILEEGERT